MYFRKLDSKNKIIFSKIESIFKADFFTKLIAFQYSIGIRNLFFRESMWCMGQYFICT